MRYEAQLKTIMIVSDYDSAHYAWDSQELQALGNPTKMAEVIINRLKLKGCIIVSAYVIEHDAEIKDYFDDSPFDINNDKVHFHLIIYFSDDGKKYAREELAEFIGIDFHYLAKGRAGRFAWDNMCSYLTHIKYEDKIQYHPSSVTTIVGRDYQELFKENQRRWLDGRQAIRNKNDVNPSKKTLDKLLKKAISMMENYEVTADELSRDPKYIILFKKPHYANMINKVDKAISDILERNKKYLNDSIKQGRYSKLDEIKTNEVLYATYIRFKDDMVYKDIYSRLK